MYAHSDELEENGVINLNAVNVERNPDMEMLLGVSPWFSTASFTLTRYSFSANRKSSLSPYSPPPIPTLLLLLMQRSFNHGLASSILHVY